MEGKTFYLVDLEFKILGAQLKILLEDWFHSKITKRRLTD